MVQSKFQCSGQLHQPQRRRTHSTVHLGDVVFGGHRRCPRDGSRPQFPGQGVATLGRKNRAVCRLFGCQLHQHSHDEEARIARRYEHIKNILPRFQKKCPELFVAILIFGNWQIHFGKNKVILKSKQDKKWKPLIH